MDLFKLLFPNQSRRFDSLVQRVINLEITKSQIAENIFKDWKLKNAERFNTLINEELLDFTSYDNVNGFKDLKKFKVSNFSESAIFLKETNLETTAFRLGHIRKQQLRHLL